MDWVDVLHERIWYAVFWYRLTRDLKLITARTYDIRYPRLRRGLTHGGVVLSVDV